MKWSWQKHPKEIGSFYWIIAICKEIPESDIYWIEKGAKKVAISKEKEAIMKLFSL